MLLKDNRTVVPNTPLKMLRMIARCTQTIICPSTNLIDRGFVVGNCLNFHVDKIDKPRSANQTKTMDMLSNNISSLARHTSLMHIEGCQAKLGCSIILSGPDYQELKQVRAAMK